MSDRRCRTRFQITGLIAGLAVWTGLSGVGGMSPLGGLFMGVLTWGMLTGLLIWLVCEGDTGEGSNQASGASDGVPGWLLVIIVLALLIWIGLSGVGEMSGPAGFLFALLAMVGLISIVVWSQRGGIDDAEPRFAMLGGLDARDRPAADSLLATVAEPDPDDAEAEAPPDDLRRIKGIGPAVEARLHELGVQHYTQIAGWSEAEIDAMAEQLGRQGSRIRNDDWVSQARQLLAGGPDA